MKGIEDLVSGFRRFQRRYFGEQRELYERLARAGQALRSMVRLLRLARRPGAHYRLP